MRVAVSLFLIDEEEKVMGAGPYELLCLVERLGSIRQAALQMQMSYTKAHRMVARLERCLPEPVLLRRVGGADRGGARLTPYGERFLAGYKLMRSHLAQAAEGEYRQFLESLTPTC